MSERARLRGEDIIIVSSDDWASGLKTSKYHIAKLLARENRVLFVNSLGLRAPSASGRDISRAASKVAAFLRGPRKVPEGPHVYTPLVFPFFRGSGPVRSANRALLRVMLHWVTSRLSFKNPIVFVFMPTFNQILGALGEKAVVYYCVDDLRSFAGVDTEWFDHEETQLLRRADSVICCSQQLQHNLRNKGREADYVPHGVDWANFRRAVSEDLPVPEDMRDIPEPRFGFYGFLTDEWIDFPLIERTASERPDWHVVLIGKLRTGLSLGALLRRPNVHYLGLKPFEELPAYTRHFTAGLVPFLINDITIHCSPLKIFEYFSGGLPVISTDIPEVRGRDADVHVARSHGEFIELCERALDEGDPASRDERSRRARAFSWDRRFEQICEIVSRGMRGPAAPPGSQPETASL